MIIYIKQLLNAFLKIFYLGGFGEQAREAAQRAVEAQTKAENAETRVSAILENLPEDLRKVKQLPQDIDEANRNLRHAQTQVDAIQELVPTAVNLLDKLSLQASRFRQLGQDIKANISALRAQIAVARTVANLVKHTSGKTYFCVYVFIF